MAKIGLFQIKKKEDRKLFEKELLKDSKSHKIEFFEEELNDAILSKVKDFDILSGFIQSNFDKKTLSKLPKLKMISTRSTGYDHIDLEECNKRKIVVSNVPFYGENTVAEHTFALILSISRNIHKSYVRNLQGQYSIEGLTGFDLKGKTIGIVGGGHIGMHVARMAKGFSMNVLVYDINKDDFLSEIINFKYANLEELLKKSDIVSLHLPYNKYTHHLINKKNISLMKKTSVLINTSRGGIIDTNSLYDALKNKKIAGAGLDVIEGEELIIEDSQIMHKHENHVKLWKTFVTDKSILTLDNVVFTPHNAFNSKEAIDRINKTTTDNIISYLNKKPKNQIN